MIFQIIQPTEELKPYISRYVFVHAEGSTDTMTPPKDDPHFINGKHVQSLLPNYGCFIFMRNVVADVNGTTTDGLILLGTQLSAINLTTVSGWFDGMMVDFEPGGMHALLGIDMEQLAGKVCTAKEYGDRGILACDDLFKSTPQAETVVKLLDAFFLGHLPHTEDIHFTRLRKVIAACDAVKGNMSAAEMAQVACLCERQFLRVFRKYVGLSPKQFVRLWRFHRALQFMQREASCGRPINLMTVALQHGYYDLSHMALEFRQMGCIAPAHFRMVGIPLTDDFSIFFA